MARIRTTSGKRPRRPPVPKEAEIQKQCLQYLCRVRGWLAWRNNSGAIKATYKGKSRFIRFNTAVGGSDLFFVTKGGRFGSVEVKRPGEVPTEKQATWLEGVRATGGVAIWVTSVDDLIAKLAAAGEGMT